MDKKINFIWHNDYVLSCHPNKNVSGIKAILRKTITSWDRIHVVEHLTDIT